MKKNHHTPAVSTHPKRKTINNILTKIQQDYKLTTHAKNTLVTILEKFYSPNQEQPDVFGNNTCSLQDHGLQMATFFLSQSQILSQYAQNDNFITEFITMLLFHDL